jgi:SAM-dependent methyltransferase
MSPQGDCHNSFTKDTSMTTYNQPTALTRYYDLFSVGIPGDVAFYMEQARQATGRVLELGTGTGRILIPVAEAGIPITGLDLSPAMLDIARKKIAALPDDVRKRINLVEGDMADFQFETRFNLIMIPFTSFCLLPTPELQRACLMCVNEHLEAGGRLVFSMFDPNIKTMSDHMGSLSGAVKRLREFDDPNTGHRVVVYDSRYHDLEAQTVRQEWIFERVDARGMMVDREYTHILLRYVFRWELHYLLELCGFEVEALYGDFYRGPFKAGQHQVWIARKA